MQAEGDISFFGSTLRRLEMKLGWEDRKKSIAGVVLTSLAIFFVGRLLTSSEPIHFPPQARMPKESTLTENPRDAGTDSSVLDPTIRYTQLGIVENERYQGNGRNIFRDVPERVRSTKAPKPLPIPPAPALASEPKITLRYFGFISMLDAPRKGCFGDGDAVFVAGEGQIVDRRFQILRIDQNSVEVEDLLEHSKHTLASPG